MKLHSDRLTDQPSDGQFSVGYRVVESKNADYPVGTNVAVFAGWMSHSVSDGKNLTKLPAYPEGVPLSYGLGVLGMPG